ncbi:hypothetical protein P5673_032787 [Acropora cervicornis]|uniref:Uncharacterized protein n=1 Tax=Acropora cervicornis TaxID=6130 RepID=A0AAD9PQR4_ACRCE|nr:hypothetical protein P5673_032787 [Acropora cervicornis]
MLEQEKGQYLPVLQPQMEILLNQIVALYTIQPPYDKLRKEYGLLEHCQEITHACECAHLAKGCTLAKAEAGVTAR